MQNTYYSPEKLKQIERIIFKFIWNGIDRIKRNTLMKGYSEGGLKAPDIFLINETCKFKQAIRTSFSTHDMAFLQKAKFDLKQLVHKSNSEDKFVCSAIKTLNRIGSELAKDLNQNLEPDSQIHKGHFEQLSFANYDTVAKLINYNSIQTAYLRAEMKRRQAVTLKDMYSSNATQASEILNCAINKLNVKIITSLEKIINEDNIEDTPNGQCILPVKVNIFRHITKVKTMDIQYPSGPLPINDTTEAFIRCRNITHPKEKMTQFLIVHNKFYNNMRLFNHKIIESPKCHKCNEIEDNHHMLWNCSEARKVWAIVSRLTHHIVMEQDVMEGSDDKWFNNVISLSRNILATNRSEDKDPSLVETRILNRISDTVFIGNNKSKLRDLNKDKWKIVNTFKI